MDLKEIINFDGYRHPWEIARADIISDLLENYKPQPKSILDFGAGDGFLVNKIASAFNINSKLLIDLNYSDKDLHDDSCKRRDLNDIESKFDIALALDVLEHIESEPAFLNLIHKNISIDGTVIFTVPAWNFLYTEHDRYLGHYRRYNLNELRTLLINGRFIPIFQSYFFLSLFLIRFIEKLIPNNKNSSNINKWKYSENSLLTKSIVKILKIDAAISFYLAKLNIKIPGLSACIVCKKA